MWLQSVFSAQCLGKRQQLRYFISLPAPGSGNGRKRSPAGAKELGTLLPNGSLATWSLLLFTFIVGGLAFATQPLVAAEVSPEPNVTFERDVMAVLSKASCNAGTCHGNVNGKGGFFLSLRGQDPVFDYQQWVHAASGRRVNRIEPAKSLALLKATAGVAHEGGKRFRNDSPEYKILTQWIEQGLVAPKPDAPSVTHLEVTPENTMLWLPEQEISLSVTAVFSDDSRRDVTRMAVYEPNDPLVHVSDKGIVRFDRPGMVTILVRYLDGQFPVRIACRPSREQFVWNDPPTHNFIDEFVFARLQQLKLQPAELAGDSRFLRRIYLDLLGVLPTADEARKFVADPAPDKRERLVDALLSRPEFASMWALKWSDLVRNEEKTLDAEGVKRLHAWMQAHFAADTPLSEFVRELIVARGSTYDHPPANYWRAHREPFVRAETTAQVFLGVRLQCAKCHNHPFDHWSQDEYYQWSSLFAGIDYEIKDNNRRDRLDKHEFVGDQIVLVKNDPKVKNGRTGQPAEPKFLGSDEPIEGDRLEHLAAWLTSPENRMFAKAQVNRIWYHLMGLGLVEPIDDLRLTNPPTHPELLERLTDEFVAGGFRLKPLVRTIVLSRTYQLDSAAPADASEVAGTEESSGEAAGFEHLYARALVRRLTAEQILDIQTHVLDVPAEFKGYPPGTRAGEIAGVERVRRELSDDDLFLRQFGKPERLLACECERSDGATLGQALRLIGGDSLNDRLRRSDNRIGKLMAEAPDPRWVIETLYWTALTRSPTDREVAAVMRLIDETGDERVAFEDLTWAILNAKELLFRN